MAETVLVTANERQIWLTQYFQEYVRQSRFRPYMTNSDINKGGIILTKFQREDENFRTINVPFIGRLKAAGVTGATVLDGNEEELTNYNCPITIDWRRNAVRLPKSTTFRTEINLWNAAKDALMVWESEKLRDDIIKAMGSVIIDGNGTCVNFDAASAAAAEHLERRQRRPGTLRVTEEPLQRDVRDRGRQCADARHLLGGDHVEGQADRQAGGPAHPSVPGDRRRRA